MPWNATNSRQVDSRGQQGRGWDGDAKEWRAWQRSQADWQGKPQKNKTKATTSARDCVPVPVSCGLDILWHCFGCSSCAPWVLLVVVAVSAESWLWPRDNDECAKVVFKEVGKKYERKKESKRPKENTHSCMQLKARKSLKKNPQKIMKKKTPTE